MNKYDLVKIIENFAPLELQEKWDCSGWVVATSQTDVKRVMIALTVDEKVFKQALNKNCDMIISHHPMFSVPLAFRGIDIYCAHTNMDKALGLHGSPEGEFLRIVEKNISVKELAQKIKKVSSNARLINNNSVQNVSKIAFCAGSGMDLYNEAIENDCDCFVTGDIKYHSAIDAQIVMFDVGHFESEILIKKVFYGLIKDKIEVVIADENSPFKTI